MNMGLSYKSFANSAVIPSMCPCMSMMSALWLMWLGMIMPMMFNLMEKMKKILVRELPSLKTWTHFKREIHGHDKLCFEIFGVEPVHFAH